VCLWLKHLSWASDQIFITVRQLRIGWCEALSLTRGRVCRLQLLLVLASAVILRSESRGTHDHILLSHNWDFLFIASYDSQGYVGSMRPRLQWIMCPFLTRSRPQREHTPEQFVFSNLRIRCNGNALSSNGLCRVATGTCSAIPVQQIVIWWFPGVMSQFVIT
jgi:hypothetical protein